MSDVSPVSLCSVDADLVKYQSVDVDLDVNGLGEHVRFVLNIYSVVCV